MRSQTKFGLGGGLLVLLLASEANADDAPLPESRWEPGLLPAVNFDSDIGVGFGAIGTLARFEPDYDPYRYRIQLLIFLSAKEDAAGDLGIPFQNHALSVDFPGLLDGWLRLAAEGSFSKFSNTGYYGLGADSRRVAFSDAELETSEVARRYHQYGRTYPRASVDARIKLWEQPQRQGKRRLELLTGLETTYNAIDVYSGSNLQSDIDRAAAAAPDDEALGDLLFGTQDHAAVGLKLGVLWDTRDHEFAPTTGSFTEASLMGVPPFDDEIGFTRFHVGTRWFAPIASSYLVFASRIAADFLVGRPPVYELSRYGVLSPASGPGGSASVRGVLLHRYHGKIKTIANAELRGNFPWFDVVGERFRVGLVGFADAGRVWADYERRDVGGRALDGPYQPLDVGLGGGARLQWGETFIVRFDYAQSPTDDTSGFYIDLGHVF